MKIGGMMVIPVGAQEVQRMLRITKKGEDEYEQETFDNFSFVPMLSGKKS
jgi:protein-L-isoaspartate(D-aspartate) O-methyltransferase